LSRNTIRSATIPIINFIAFSRSICRYFRFEVTGIDYSPLGCKKALAILARDGIEGEIEQADFMHPPDRLLGAYDVGVSFGVAEHFDDTAECLAAFRRYLKPGGLLITAIPNLSGVIGTLQKLLDREVYDIHVALDRDALAAAHRKANLDVIDCDYIVCSNFGVLTLGDHAYPLNALRRFIRLAMMGISAIAWPIDRYLMRLPVSRLLSGYVICIARVR
jgi:SAM-dependent methyltransferase